MEPNLYTALAKAVRGNSTYIPPDPKGGNITAFDTPPVFTAATTSRTYGKLTSPLKLWSRHCLISGKLYLPKIKQSVLQVCRWKELVWKKATVASTSASWPWDYTRARGALPYGWALFFNIQKFAPISSLGAIFFGSFGTSGQGFFRVCDICQNFVSVSV